MTSPAQSSQMMPTRAAGQLGQPDEQMPTSVFPAVRLVGLSKNFGNVTAVDGLDLDIADGEFFAMLGPSGSGRPRCCA